MELHLKKNQAAEIMIPMVDSTTPASLKTGESVTDTGYYKDGAGAWTALAITDTVTEIATTGMYTIELTAAEMNHDLIMIKFTAANSADSVVIIRSFAVDIGDVALASVCTETRLAELAAANLPANIDTLLTRITAAVALASVCTEIRLAELDAENLPADVAANATPTQVNAEVVDVLKVDTIPERTQGIPPITPTFEQAFSYFYMMLRNKIDVDAGFKELYNNAGVVVWKKALVDDGTNYNEGTGQSGP